MSHLDISRYSQRILFSLWVLERFAHFLKGETARIPVYGSPSRCGWMCHRPPDCEVWSQWSSLQANHEPILSKLAPHKVRRDRPSELRQIYEAVPRVMKWDHMGKNQKHMLKTVTFHYDPVLWSFREQSGRPSYLGHSFKLCELHLFICKFRVPFSLQDPY